MELSYVNLWSVIEDVGENSDVVIKKDRDNNKVTIMIYDKKKFNFFGYEVSKRRLKTEFILSSTEDNSLFSKVLNPKFEKDANVDVSAYMRFVEQGFNENKTDDFRLDILHCAVGMAGESGEVLEIIKKHVYHSKPMDTADMLSECGDKMWYFFNFLRLLNLSFADVLKANVVKLNERYPNGRDKNYLKNDKNHTLENTKITEQVIKKT